MKIHLINMPFAGLHLPSIALTQLRSVLEARLGARVAVELHYINHEFGTYVGPDFYNFIAGDMSAHSAGFGDWFFRQAAFPDLTDNQKEFVRRYGNRLGEKNISLYTRFLADKREKVSAFLDQIIDQRHLEDGTIIGFTSMFFQTMASAALARKLKERNPQLITAMGGANCEAGMGIELVHHLPGMDFVFSGPALVNFPQFVEYILDGDLDRCHTLDGVFSRKNTRSISSLAGAKPLTTKDEELLNGVAVIGRELDINEEVDLNYDSFIDSFHKYFPKREAHLLFETSRGCWWGQKSHCTFCGLNGGTMNYRAMESNKAISFMQKLFDKYGERINHFCSVDNILPKNYVTDVFPRLHVPKNVHLFYEVKANLKVEEMAVLSRAQVLEIQPGIEALASSTLRLMRKGTTAFGNLQFLRNAVRFGIKPWWNLLVGFPGEKADVYQKYLADISLLTHFPPPTGAFTVRFDRFSPYFTLANEYKLDLHPLDFYEMSYPFPADVLQRMAYYFSDHNYDSEYVTLVAQFIKRLEEAIRLWQSRWRADDGLLPPRLYLQDPEGSTSIYDSRSGEALEQNLTEAESMILRALDEPADIAGLSARLPQLERSGITQTIDALQAKSLLFQEGVRWLSLVFGFKPDVARHQLQ